MTPGAPAGRRLRVAIVGAGWAGLAGAVAATQAGHAVAVYEAARVPGGRARAVEHLPLPDHLPGGPAPLDNGQHILVGAYTETLRVMRLVGADPDRLLLRLPLDLRFADGGGIVLPRWPAPLDLLAGIATARGWSLADRWSLLRTSLGWRLAGFRCDPATTVAGLCAGTTARVREELIEPLCVSALNTPAAEASGTVFLRVLRDALFGVPRGGDLLLPRTDLGSLFPVPALRWLAARGAAVHLGTRVQAISATGGGWAVDGEHFDRVLLACPPGEAARLAGGAAGSLAAPWCAAARALRFEAIATVYTQGPRGLDRAMVALRSGPDLPAQFVFDRGHLGAPAGLLAFVASASRQERDALETAVVRQAREQLGLAVRPFATIVDKRATFACTPELARPGGRIAPGLLACGDYVDGPYPATLEGAVRSGTAAGAGPA